MEAKILGDVSLDFGLQNLAGSTNLISLELNPGMCSQVAVPNTVLQQATEGGWKVGTCPSIGYGKKTGDKNYNTPKGVFDVAIYSTASL